VRRADSIAVDRSAWRDDDAPEQGRWATGRHANRQAAWPEDWFLDDHGRAQPQEDDWAEEADATRRWGDKRAGRLTSNLPWHKRAVVVVAGLALPGGGYGILGLPVAALVVVGLYAALYRFTIPGAFAVVAASCLLAAAFSNPARPGPWWSAVAWGAVLGLVPAAVHLAWTFVAPGYAQLLSGSVLKALLLVACAEAWAYARPEDWWAPLAILALSLVEAVGTGLLKDDRRAERAGANA
jgi:hypothetical protein